MTRKAIALAAATALSGCLAAFTTGCCGPQKYVLVGEQARLDGLAVSVSQRRGDYQIVVIAPTGGWMIKKDDEQVEDGTPTIFITAVPPGPDTIVTQQLVEHPIRTNASACGPMTVLIRQAPEMEEGAQFGGYEEVPLRR